MQGNRGGRNPFFDAGDPFAGFGSFGGFGGPRSMLSSFFGGRDPFDDPFFNQPFGGMMQPSIFGGHPFPNMHPFGLLEQQVPEPRRSRGPIIEEISSDDEKGAEEKGRSENSKKHSRSSNDEAEERRSKQLHKLDLHNRPNDYMTQPQTGSFCFQSSTVTYGGANGAYYTSSTTRRTGSDGVTFEESKEADTASRKATHKIARGIHNKGHSLTRKLSSDGNMETMQTLHNLDEDELPVFEAAWKGKQLPGSFNGIGGSDYGHRQALPAATDKVGSSRSLPVKKMAANGKGRR